MSMKGISFEQGDVSLTLKLEDGMLVLRMDRGVDDDEESMGFEFPPEDVAHLANFLAPKPYPDGGCVLCHKPKDQVMVVAEGATPGAGVCDSCAAKSVTAALGFANEMIAKANLLAAMAEVKAKLSDTPAPDDDANESGQETKK